MRTATLDEITAAGIDVSIGHSRYFTGHKRPLAGTAAQEAVAQGAKLQAKGGVTEVFLHEPYSIGIFPTMGIARAHNKLDKFNRKRGAKLATQRALDELIERYENRLAILRRLRG